MFSSSYGSVEPKQQSYWDIITSNKHFSIFQQLITLLPDLQASLQNPDWSVKTLFIPDDQAFKHLERKVPGITAKVKANPQLLSKIISYHGTQDPYPSKNLENGMKLTMLDGNQTTITQTHPCGMPHTKINQATIKHPESVTSSGQIVHLIDQVLLPPTLPK